MNDLSIKQLYQSIRQYAKVVGNINEEAKLLEVCDFGDSFGFLLASGDKLSNIYWCVKKKTYEFYTYRPNINIKQFMERKVLSNDVVE